MTKHFTWLLLATLVAGLLTTAAQAVAVVDFFSMRGTTATTLSGTGNTDDPSLGTTTETADAARMIGYFPEQTLVNIGDKITLSFSVSFVAADGTMSNGTDNFRFALFDRNGETQEATNSNLAVNGTSNTNAFRGYWYGVDTNTNATGAQGAIRARSGTTADDDPFANASAPLLGTAGGEEVTLAVGETYTGTMILTLTNTNEITLSGSFTDPDAGPNEYAFVDTAPPTKSFSVVGFLNGNAIDADQANFQNIDVTYTPFSAALVGDHNGDGVVDAADYVAWRKDPDANGGDPDGYDDWVTDFGESNLGSGGGQSVGAVPEPALLPLAGIAGLVAFGLMRRRPSLARVKCC
jgi:hypothetical protein